MTQADQRSVDAAARSATQGLPPRRRSWLREFVHQYGWRAYALPFLVVITVVALVTAGHKPGRPAASTGTSTGGATAPPTAQGTQALSPDVPGAGSLNTSLPADALPPGGPYTFRGDGTYRVLAGTSPVVGTGGRLYRYDIEVENGITGIDLNQFASMVQTVLDDPRSWTAGHNVTLERVDSGPVDFHVTLTSSNTVRSLCGYDIPIETSCYQPAGQSTPVDRVVINDARWVRGDAAYVGDLDAYRTYMINHEDGHALGHMHAHECLADGLAPVMMQQTIGLRSAVTGALCQANPWPYPPGANDAPGAEQPDTPQNSQFQVKGD